MLDINGGELRQGGLAQLLCEVVEISDQGVRLRVMNSDMDLFVEAKHDEVLGGLVADSELTTFEEDPREQVTAARGTVHGPLCRQTVTGEWICCGSCSKMRVPAFE
jgi:hypothetical protein